MIKSKYSLILLIGLLLSIYPSCKKDEVEMPPSSVSENFESGSIGEINKISDLEWELSLADDNDNAALPDSWRNWWYVKMENISTSSPTSILLKNRGWPYYYLPVYSYDNIGWARFTEDEVIQNEDDELLITKQFSNTNVWIARFYPYTFTDLENYLIGIENSPYVSLDETQKSQGGKSLYLIKLSDFNVPVINKKRVFMHARTHPAETPPSFLIEGMIDFLLSGSTDASQILAKHEFYIFPMQNIDGVTVGNYRSTPLSENLEVMWYYNSENTLNLTEDSPQEVKIVHQYALDVMNDGGPPISMALNLHASNSEPDIRPFFYPHFGTEEQGYSVEESSLWGKQNRFINSFASHYGSDMIEPTTDEGGSSFATKTYPESWWWVNYQDQVMAMTMEMTYGRSGYSPRWIQPNDLRSMGRAVILGIRDYYEDPFMSSSSLKNTDLNNYINNLKYPELYPPNAEDELKK